jgi:thiol-disulfide isomerase/thioredoxin
MKTFWLYILLLSSLLIITAFPNNVKSYPPYAASFWTDGTYDHPAVGMFIKYNLTNPSFIHLPTEDTTQIVLLLKGKNKRNIITYWSVVINSDKNILINEIFFKPDSSNRLSSTIDLKLQSNSNRITPLELKILPNYNTLLYRWINENIDAGGIPTVSNKPVQIEIGSPLPDFTVKTLYGDSIRFNELKNNVVVINWWGTWCKPCIAEIPGLNLLVEKYKEYNRITFLAIASDTESKLRSFLSKQKFNYQQTMQDSSTIKLFGDAYPRNLVINADGIVIYDKVGGSENTYLSIEKVIDDLLVEDK